MKNIKTILIIDDMKHMRDILWFSLKEEGYKPILAEDGIAGLGCLLDEKNKIDLVILDVMMPKMNGLEVLELIRKSEKSVSNIPVIMLTAKAQKADVIKGMKTGANDYIVKPYKFVELLNKIRTLIG